LTESSFLKSHKQFVKRHLNRRAVYNPNSKYPCAHQSKNRNSRELEYILERTCGFITLDHVMIEAMTYLSTRIQDRKLRKRALRYVKWLKWGRL